MVMKALQAEEQLMQRHCGRKAMASVTWKNTVGLKWRESCKKQICKTENIKTGHAGLF